MSPARERLATVLAVLALGGLLVLAAAQPFAVVRIAGVSGTTEVPAAAAAPPLAPLGLVLLALAAALTIAGRTGRGLLLLLAAVLGAIVTVAALRSALDPTAGAATRVTAATGAAGSGAAALVTRATGTAWPWVAAVAGVLLAVVAAVAAVRSRRWPTAGRRYTAGSAPAAPSTDPVAEWDAMTAGEDPTDPPSDPGASRPGEPPAP